MSLAITWWQDSTFELEDPPKQIKRCLKLRDVGIVHGSLHEERIDARKHIRMDPHHALGRHLC